MNDISILYYTANREPIIFMKQIQNQILSVVGDTPIVSVSQHPISFGKNIWTGEIGMSLYNLYYQVLLGVRNIDTPYVAITEDDTLYPKEHFWYRPPKGVIGYDLNKFALFTWKHKVFSKREDRRVMSMCIADTQALRSTLEERYAKYPSEAEVPAEIYQFYWGEPGRFEDHLGIRRVTTEKWECQVPSVTFFTEFSLGFRGLGKRKALGPVQTDILYPWGKAEDLYENIYHRPGLGR